LPQYFLISVAEVLVCVPALEFAYDDSPEHLRSLVTSLWNMSQV
jgi:dipeptide/tripeptide permease